jgi:hypothetical protein
MLVEATSYFAKSGRADEVVEMRRRGTRLRVTLGLPPGRILIKIGKGGPDVRWECQFASQADFDTDLAARDASPEFSEQRRLMGALLERFERHVFRSDDAETDEERS